MVSASLHLISVQTIYSLLLYLLLNFGLDVVSLNHIEVVAFSKNAVKVAAISCIYHFANVGKMQLIATIRDVMGQVKRYDVADSVAVHDIKIKHIYVPALDAAIYKRRHKPSAASKSECRSLLSQSLNRGPVKVIAVYMREQHKFKLIANTFEGLKRYAAVNEDFFLNDRCVTFGSRRDYVVAYQKSSSEACSITSVASGCTSGELFIPAGAVCSP